MHFHPDDVARLLRIVPLGSLLNEKVALAFLTRQASTAQEMAHVLARYPDVRCEPLDFHYGCLHCLGAIRSMGAELLEDLLTAHGWPGVLWGSFLVALSPSEDHLPLLRTIQPLPRYRWALDLANGAITGAQSDRQEALHRAAQTLRHAFSALKPPIVQLRRAPTAQELLARQQRIRAAYRMGGADAALDVLRAGGAA